jgi:hypothetical protein
MDIQVQHRKTGKINWFPPHLATDREFMERHDYEINDPAFELNLEKECRLNKKDSEKEIITIANEELKEQITDSIIERKKPGPKPKNKI